MPKVAVSESDGEPDPSGSPPCPSSCGSATCTFNRSSQTLTSRCIVSTPRIVHPPDCPPSGLLGKNSAWIKQRFLISLYNWAAKVRLRMSVSLAEGYHCKLVTAGPSGHQCCQQPVHPSVRPLPGSALVISQFFCSPPTPLCLPFTRNKFL